jgi:L-fuconate dehydratase
MPRITDVQAYDLRFPTSRTLAGSDAMNPQPDYSAAYVVLKTDAGLEGHGFTFTIGRGNELCVEAIRSLAPLVQGLTLEAFKADSVAVWYALSGDSQLRWVGPEKGVIHLATAAVINALWDLWAKHEQQPLWKLLADMPAEQLVRCVPFRYVTDAITPDEALAILHTNDPTRADREADLQERGYPAYTTSVGWLGYTDDHLRQLCREGLVAGWTHFKLKVGANLQDDIRRLTIVRQEVGKDATLMLDANQVWDVDQAIAWMRELAQFEPWWIEEPTSPDDILGHARIAEALKPIRVATGEHCQNRVIFKQLLQAKAIGFCQLDAARLGGVNEALAVLLLAAKFQVPVCPHAGGVGLCEYVQHLSMLDYLRISASQQDRLIEYVDHLHDHFVNPVQMRRGRYMPPGAPGYSATMRPESIAAHTFPDGPVWADADRPLPLARG